MLPVACVLFFFNLGSEKYRGDRPDLTERWNRAPASLLWPPWEALRMYVSREEDERLYYQYARLAAGESADDVFIAHRRQLGSEALCIRQTGGWRLPHRDFSVEYPPLAWFAFLPPFLVSKTLAGYRVAFAVWMSLLMLAAVAIAMRNSERRRRLGRVAALLLFAIGPLLVVRYDALPALACAAALGAIGARRFGLAGLAIGLGGAAKIYPFLLLPIFVAAALGARRPRDVGWLAGASVLGFTVPLLPFLTMAPSGLARDLALLGARPLELESVLATPFVLAGRGSVVAGFGSSNIAGAGTHAAAAVGTPLGALLMVAVCVLVHRRARVDLARAASEGALAGLLCLLSTSKVLSPQFLIWTVPAVLALDGRRGLRYGIGLMVAGLLAQLWFPYFWHELVALHRPWTQLLALRNALLVAMCASMLIELYRNGSRSHAV